MKKHYNKLIRDKIPQIIAQSGCEYAISSLSEADYLNALKEKLIEEATEVAEASPDEMVTELADLLEVMDTLIAIAGIEKAEVLEKQRERRERRGGFEKRIKLLWTETQEG
jgi:predicted house-cleaning noncanonical NTP pyrophosphatase (MazG superfamily)